VSHTEQAPATGVAFPSYEVNVDPYGRYTELRAAGRVARLPGREEYVVLGIPRSTVHQLARRGDLPGRRVGRRWLSFAIAFSPPSRRSMTRLRGGRRSMRNSPVCYSNLLLRPALISRQTNSKAREAPRL
jgi:hypothetical protein